MSFEQPLRPERPFRPIRFRKVSASAEEDEEEGDIYEKKSRGGVTFK